MFGFFSRWFYRLFEAVVPSYMGEHEALMAGGRHTVVYSGESRSWSLAAA